MRYPDHGSSSSTNTSTASLRDIAAMIGVSKQTVTELARDYRIPLRRPRSPLKYAFDRDWLYREHVVRGRRGRAGRGCDLHDGRP